MKSSYSCIRLTNNINTIFKVWKYFLFIKAEDFSEKYDSTASKKLFRAKIIDSIDNIDFNTINNSEYIKKEFILWERRFYPYIGLETYDDAEKNRKTIFYPDEYNYLYSYKN